MISPQLAVGDESRSERSALFPPFAPLNIPAIAELSASVTDEAPRKYDVRNSVRLVYYAGYIESVDTENTADIYAWSQSPSWKRNLKSDENFLNFVSLII